MPVTADRVRRDRLLDGSTQEDGAEWAEKPLDSLLTIPAELHDAVMSLPPEDRLDRAKVNEAAAFYA